VVNEGKGRLFRRKDGKYLLYIPVALAEDSMFPFREELCETDSLHVKISSKLGDNELVIERWKGDV